MNRLPIVLLFALLTTAAVFAQGRVDFRNRMPGLLDAPVFHGDGVTRLAGGDFTAQLYFSPSEAGIYYPVGAPFAFLTGTQAGYWEPHEVFLPGVQPGETAFVKVVVLSLGVPWIDGFPSYTKRGESKVLRLQLTDGAVPLVGLESFSIRPESLRVGWDNGQVVIKWENLGATGYTLLSSPSLAPSATWTEVSSQASSILYVGHEFSVTNSVNGPARFYRLQRWP